MSEIFQSQNPATGEVFGHYQAHTPEAVQKALEQAAAAQQNWARQPVASRLPQLNALATLLEQRREPLARLMQAEMGKVQAEALAEVDKCRWLVQYYAEAGPAMLTPEPQDLGAGRALLRFDPLGLVLAIMPWNFPFWQVFRCAIPALLAGNGVVLKHAPGVPACAEAIAGLIQEAGFPEGLFANLRIPVAELEAVVGDPRIQMISLTGSTLAGRSLAALAGKHLKKTVLELGGSDPYLVLADADLEWAAQCCARARLLNAGQSCIAAKRLLVEASVLDDFVAHLQGALHTHPALAPLAREDLRATLHQQVLDSCAQGAKLHVGGTLPEGPGYFYPPTLLSAVKPGMPVFDQETFGPVAVVSSFANETEALQWAHQTPYGLGAAIFSQDLERAWGLAAQIQAGSCFINDFVRSDPRLPFGGVKDSGHGRELGLYGLREFVNVKSCWQA